MRLFDLSCQIPRLLRQWFWETPTRKSRADRIANSLKDGVFCVEDGRITYTNSVAKQLLQWEPALAESVLGLAQKGTSASCEFSVQVTDPVGGRTHHFLMRRLDHGSSNEIVIMARNFTRAVEAEVSKSHFIGLLSHEIRTPVTSLVMAMGLLDRAAPEFENPVHQKLIKTAAKETDRLRELIEDLFSVNRFEFGVTTLNRRNTDLRRILRSACDSFQADAQERSLQIVQEVDPEVPSSGWVCEVDPSKMGWALSNLVQYAVFHSPKGSRVQVGLHHSQSGDGKKYFEFRVQDSSPGLSGDRLEYLMEPYSGVYDLRVARSEATGTSISIARQVAESHGGSLRVCSAPGSGAHFQLRFPSQQRSING